MLSILIPTYNYDISALVKSLHAQVMACEIDFEIIVFDDASKEFHTQNEQINSLLNTAYTILPQNIGRSAIRNKLAEAAVFENLLFLDADTQVIQANFISSYLTAITAKTQIIYGGIVYQKERPESEKVLRWVYGNKREALTVSQRNEAPYLRFLTLNFLIKKDVFRFHRFDEDIPNLRHEDTLFALGAKKHQLHITHIDNPVIHLGLESSTVFLNKSIESVEALHLFVTQNLIEAKDTALSQKGKQWGSTITKIGSRLFLKLFGAIIKKNLTSKKPSLFWFDVYRLAYYLTLDTQK